MSNYFDDLLNKIDVKLSEEQKSQFMLYYDLLIEWNNVMNLTAITELDEVILKHFIDSLTIIKAIDVNKKLSVIDIGTGAGFPGIPIKIAFPELEVVLLDSLNKRVKFLNEVIDRLGLKGITAIHGRAEDIGQNINYREKFDISVSRAVAQLATLSEYCMPFVKIGGRFIAYKSGKVSEELDNAKKALSTFGSEDNEVISFILPYTDIERTLVVINKTAKTPKVYPRKAGKPSKEPIM